jgi:hypothetical protein
MFVGDDLVDVAGLRQFFDLRRPLFLRVVVAIFVEGIFEGRQRFFESDAISIKEGITANLDGLLIFRFLLLVERGQLFLIIAYLDSVFLVQMFFLLDTHGQIGKLEVLFFEPVDDLDVSVVLQGGFLLLQLLVLPPQILQIRVYLRDGSDRIGNLFFNDLVVIHYLLVHHLQIFAVRTFHHLDLHELQAQFAHPCENCPPGWQHDILQ